MFLSPINDGNGSSFVKGAVDCNCPEAVGRFQSENTCPTSGAGFLLCSSALSYFSDFPTYPQYSTV